MKLGFSPLCDLSWLLCLGRLDYLFPKTIKSHLTIFWLLSYLIKFLLRNASGGINLYIYAFLYSTILGAKTSLVSITNTLSPVLSGVRISQSLVFYVVFYRSLFILLTIALFVLLLIPLWYILVQLFIEYSDSLFYWIFSADNSVK